MLFTKKNHRYCAFCEHAVPLEEDFVCCKFRGVRTADRRCLRFRYDPTKRTPPQRAVLAADYDESRFQL